MPKISPSPFQASCFTVRETHPQYPFSHTYHHQCVYQSVDHAHLPPICCYDELLSRLKKTHCDPEPNTTSKSSSWKAEGQASYQSLSRLQRKNQGQLLCVCCTN
ncbi:hypothetical protein NC651_007064 [Populus alba x Populus x berolinensis]|nr:hypothetical protein NC651_007064 [Populus alba x Populus x berolinensis]